MLKDKKIIVTGGAGFVGSHLVDELIKQRADVVILDNLSHGRYVNPDATFHKVDVTSESECIKHFDGAFAVFNLAATVAGVQWNKDNNLAMFEENIKLATVPVSAASKADVPHFVQMSSVCIYSPDNQNAPLEETGYNGFTHGANWGYGQAKRDGELAALHWSGINHVVVARPTNMFGPRDHFTPIEKAHVIPALMQRIDAIPNDKPDIEVYGSPSVVREFMYVKDCARALVMLLNGTTGREVYNIGTGGETAVTIQDLVHLIGEKMGKNVRPHWRREMGGGDDVRRSNPSKIRDIGWHHEYSLEDGLEETVAWFKRYKGAINE